jgi:hypothetical protein
MNGYTVLTAFLVAGLVGAYVLFSDVKDQYAIPAAYAAFLLVAVLFFLLSRKSSKV